METIPNKETAGKAGQSPTLEQVTEWVKRDAHTAHYFLGLLIRYPNVLEDAAREIYQHAKNRTPELEQMVNGEGK